LRLGNPLESEQAAFRWVIAVIVGAAFVIALAELVSTAVGFVAALLLGATVAVVGARGAWRMIRGTDEIGGDEANEDGGVTPDPEAGRSPDLD